MLAAGLLAGISSCNTGLKDAAKQQFLETGFMNSSINPADNFYDFVNGKWLDTAQIPGTESGIGSFLDLRNKTRENLLTLLNEISKSNAAAGTNEQKVGDFYASGMDTVIIEKRGYGPIKPNLEKVAAITDAKGVMKYVMEQQMEMNGLLFTSFVGADEKNSSMNILLFYQGGLGLPDRDYYFKTDPRTQSVAAACHCHSHKV